MGRLVRLLQNRCYPQFRSGHYRELLGPILVVLCKHTDVVVTDLEGSSGVN
jgi:hypothetical protein